MLRPPVPNTDRFLLEEYKPGQLLELFATCMSIGSRGPRYSLLPEAWGTLFSGLFLSPVDLIEGMRNGTAVITAEDESMLRRFIKEDCANRGTFAINVIKKGGMIDRSALIMIADPADLAGFELEGTTALHLLIKACDKRVRPVLIKKAGGRLLSGVFDHDGIPVLLALFGLSDMCAYDLDAIQEIFSPAELKTVMAKNRMGRNAYEIFTEVADSARRKPSRDRNAFSINHAVKTTNSERAVRSQINSPASGSGVIAPQMKTGVPQPREPVKSNLPVDSRSPVKSNPPINGNTSANNGTPVKSNLPINSSSPTMSSTPVFPEVPARSLPVLAPPMDISPVNRAGPDPGASPMVPCLAGISKPRTGSDTEKLMKIMVVEDDPVILKLLQLRLLAMGYPVCAMAESGEDAVKIAGQTKPDIVFMDIGLPGKMDGIDAAREIKAHSHPRIVFLTGHSDPELVDRARDVLPDGYILKPFTDTDLRVTLTLLK